MMENGQVKQQRLTPPPDYNRVVQRAMADYQSHTMVSDNSSSPVMMHGLITGNLGPQLNGTLVGQHIDGKLSGGHVNGIVKSPVDMTTSDVIPQSKFI